MKLSIPPFAPLPQASMLASMLVIPDVITLPMRLTSAGESPTAALRTLRTQIDEVRRATSKHSMTLGSVTTSHSDSLSKTMFQRNQPWQCSMTIQVQCALAADADQLMRENVRAALHTDLSHFESNLTAVGRPAFALSNSEQHRPALMETLKLHLDSVKATLGQVPHSLILHDHVQARVDSPCQAEVWLVSHLAFADPATTPHT